ncbi:hypothetical protein Bccel_0244 [Pseudobacteroides cellulosolvens ATCC 35603 = DSM 2933]|uniref:Uncharacterized protein n=1 Tax=Pseudobacteroides cellulosolvens ATCC 35603 = DSM 2933 TaxID=398512 RepID=A0A0L6JHL7_9FIRM|nr:hypothetical protein Bccel_0244 [Pseudobacteroides cellulosolvens ATCC 35603 = DSM 2933]
MIILVGLLIKIMNYILLSTLLIVNKVILITMELKVQVNKDWLLNLVHQ